MISNAPSPQAFLDSLPADRQQPMVSLRDTILQHLPPGFSEEMSYGMLGYVVPHSLYPAGYHCDPKLPLPFLSIASQKNFIAMYHMGIYANPDLLAWFVAEYPKHSKTKLDMGKSCIRFKKPDQIPLNLIGVLVAKMTPQDWMAQYEAVFKK